MLLSRSARAGSLGDSSGVPAHANGFLLTGEFNPSPEAVGLARAPHVQRVSTPVTVRFSDFAGIPTVADNDPQNASPRGFAVRFHLGEHVHTDIVAHSVDGFPVRTAEEFLEFFNALIATDPAAPHPNAIEQFLGKHPAALALSRRRNRSRRALHGNHISRCLLSVSQMREVRPDTAAIA